VHSKSNRSSNVLLQIVRMKREIYSSACAEQRWNVIEFQRREPQHNLKVPVHFEHATADAQVRTAVHLQRASPDQLKLNDGDVGLHNVNDQKATVTDTALQDAFQRRIV